MAIQYRGYDGTIKDLHSIAALIEKDLSEPYSIFTYHFFLHEQPHLCRLAFDGSTMVGVIIGRISTHRTHRRGYIGMLAVALASRTHGIGTFLVTQLVEIMIKEGVDEIVLETEVGNVVSLALYEKLGFVRDKRLVNYYLNGSDAFRLKLWTVSSEEQQRQQLF